MNREHIEKKVGEISRELDLLLFENCHTAGTIQTSKMIKLVKESLLSVASEARKEAGAFELEVLRRHLEGQIWKSTVNTDSIYRYIDTRLNSLKESDDL